MNDEIALFIDFENIRYSLINVQHREPDPQELIGLSRRFGTVMVARAYADWTRQPEFFKGSLTAAMIDRVDCPAKVRERFRQSPAQQSFQPQPAYTQAPNDTDEYEGQEFVEPHDLDEDELREAQLLDADDRILLNGMADGPDGASADERRMRIERSERGERFERYERGGRPESGNGYSNGSFHSGPQPVITQSTVDLNMLMDIIETVFDRPSIQTFILMTGDRDFTRIAARLKLRLNKRVIVVGIPGTVSRDLISAAEQFIPLGFTGQQAAGGGYQASLQAATFAPAQGPVEPEEPGFIQFLDYIDRHWSWRTVGGVANFIGDPFNPKNRFRGRLTRESARDLLRLCIDEGILLIMTDPTGSENLRLNRQHPAVDAGLNEAAMR